jgi:DNA-binding beta-propeller fold protein YncE
MTGNGTSAIGDKLGSIDNLVPAFAVAVSPVNPQAPNEGQVYLPFVQVSGHTVRYGMAVADLLSMSVLRIIWFDEEPTDIAVAPDGRFVYLAGSEHLLSVQTDTLEVTPLPLRVPAGAIAASSGLAFDMALFTGVTTVVSADGSELVLVGGQQQPPAVEENGYLALFDPGTNTVKKAVTSRDTTDFQSHHVVVTPDGRYAVVNLQLQRIDIVDLASFTIAKSLMFIPDSVQALAATPDGKSVLVAVGPFGGGTTGSVMVVDLTAKSVLKTFTLPSGPLQLAVSPDGQNLFVTVKAPDPAGHPVTLPTLLVLDANTGTQLASLPNAGPFAIDSTAQRLYVFDSAAEALGIFELND